MQTIVTVYTDGACKGNPGMGGWGAILKYKDTIKEIYGACPNTTNNRMELTAVIESLKLLKRQSHLAIYTDSQYVQKGMTEWIFGWKKKNWKDVKNVDLWLELDQLAAEHKIDWHWVRGHNGDIGNERADMLANYAIDKYLNSEKL